MKFDTAERILDLKKNNQLKVILKSHKTDLVDELSFN